MTRRLFLTALAVAAAAGPASAQFDRGRKKLAPLFAEPAAKAAEATVRVQGNGRDLCLGVVAAPGGYILTKASELKGPLAVQFGDGTSYDAAHVGYHKPTDLALLKIDADPKYVTFAPATDKMVGRWVATVAPGDAPAAVGVVSVGPRKLYSDEAKITNGNKGFLGIVFVDAPGGGVEVKAVTPDGAAWKAQVRRNDVIRELAGQVVQNQDTFAELLDAYRPGETVRLLIKRGDEETNVSVRLADRAEFDRGMLQNKSSSLLSDRRTGFPKVISHDTVIDRTDCGGPLVDLDGNVIGLNIARAGRVETWALPADVIDPALRDMKAGKFPPSAKK